jgi:hypothetical protein
MIVHWIVVVVVGVVIVVVVVIVIGGNGTYGIVIDDLYDITDTFGCIVVVVNGFGGGGGDRHIIIIIIIIIPRRKGIIKGIIGTVMGRWCCRCPIHHHRVGITNICCRITIRRIVQ